MIAKGTRVQLHPATDEWMQGDRYGEIVGYSRKHPYKDTSTGRINIITPYRVKLNKSGRIRRFHPDHLIAIDY